jgi:putative alpha-1,2-mannosidase
MAAATGAADLAAVLRSHVGNWRNAFEAGTGLLRADSEYYEGTRWTYSFRPIPDMAARIAFAGGRERFTGLLDTFFGYRDLADGSVDPEPDASSWQRLQRDDRFEGLNNESDIESPYAYLWVGRHDRTAEIVRAAMRSQFTNGPNGLPGNNDSGGLTSWYVWNALGLFPVSGRNLYLIGSPIVSEAAVPFRHGTLRVVADGNRDDAIYVREATLNDKPLDRAWLSISEVEQGGTLRLSMGTRPSGWGTVVPPSV